jgi:4-amino-4-deoxy-L-arabinose transferase-like glycosyltransferase
MSLAMIETSNREKYVLYCLLLAAILILPWLPLSKFYTRGEPREALIAQSMLATHNYILPRGYSNTLPSKPPVLHWLITIASSIGGEVTEFTARIPSVLTSLLFVVFLAWLVIAYETYSLRWAPLILLTSFEWMRAAISCRVDMLHAASLAAGLLCYFLWQQKKENKTALAAIFFLVLATLSKGPVGAVIPGIIIVISSIINRDGVKAAIFRVIGFLLPVILLAGIWYLLAYLQGGEEFLQKFWYENGQRFLSTMEDAPHKHSVFYLFAVLLLGLLPWTLLAPWLIKFRKQFSLKEEKTAALYNFCILCSLVITLFYCLPSSKRGVYLLAAYPFYCILLAPMVSFISRRLRLLRLVAIYCVLVIIANAVVLPLAASHDPEDDIALFLPQVQKANEAIFSYSQEFYAVSFYAKKPINVYDSKVAPAGLVLFKKRDLNNLQDALKNKRSISVIKEWQRGLFWPSDEDVLLARIS